MDVNKDDYILGFWFAQASNGDNWTMTAKKHPTLPDHWLVEYRFRYKEDDKIFESKDTKSFYNKMVVGTEEEVKHKLDDLFYTVITPRFNNRKEYIDVRGNQEKFIYLLAQADYVHVKKVSGEDVKKYTTKRAKKGENNGRKQRNKGRQDKA